MADSRQGDTFAGFNALLGYLGGQVATGTIVDRLLWPQRHFSHPHLGSLPRLVFLYSMSGPLSTVALETIDKTYRHGLLQGAAQGHMLGTAFYPDSGLRYTLHARDGDPKYESQVRNCVWVQALLNMPIGALEGGQTRTSSIEDGLETETKHKPVRAKNTVLHLTLTMAEKADIENRAMHFVAESAQQVEIISIVAILATESVGIAIAIGVAIILRSWWSLFFLLPLFMRMLSASLALQREGLHGIKSGALPDQEETHRDWEVQCQPMDSKFILISGPPSVVSQFFRHYGHPKRDRLREVVQLGLVVMYGLYFPLGLLCQALWLPSSIQYVWTVWQVYNVIAMHMDRFTQQGAMRPSTDAKICRAFLHMLALDEKGRSSDISLLFGQDLKRPDIVKATLNFSVQKSYKDAQDYLKSKIRQ